VRVAFFGTSGFAVPALAALAGSSHEVITVVTAPARPSGRGRKLVPSPVEEEARARGLSLLAPDDPHNPAFIAELASLTPDVALLAAYGCVLKPRLLALPRYGFVNIHPSLLPRFRGAAPIQRAILAGDKKTGVTVIALSEQVDAGDIIKQLATDIGPDETAGELSERLAALGARLAIEALAHLADATAGRTPQDPGQATRAPKLKKAERNVDWREPAQQIHNHIRAFSPEPGAITSFRRKCLVLLRSRVHAAVESDRPGLLLLEQPGLVVAAGRGALEITQLKPEGSRVQAGLDFRNGNRLVAGERFAAA
jgi:methionyl-tRNA formyltransferase